MKQVFLIAILFFGAMSSHAQSYERVPSAPPLRDIGTRADDILFSDSKSCIVEVTECSASTRYGSDSTYVNYVKIVMAYQGQLYKGELGLYGKVLRLGAVASGMLFPRARACAKADEILEKYRCKGFGKSKSTSEHIEP
ncbi:hypothetical protein D3C87_111750 [compost metagenome]